jgi:hypothetical protein
MEERETAGMILTLVCLAARCGLGQTALRLSGAQLRQRAQLVEHKLFERVVSHSEPIPSASFVVIVQ